MNSKIENYDPQKLEKNIQNYWKEKELYRANFNGKDGKKKYYACSMLPYPSGKLHMGHVRNYTINDVIARWKRMKGFQVLMPMGWDAFGLPAENAALNQKKSPAQWTEENISTMKKQLKSLGFAIDWSREINTSSPDYYKWSQLLFLKMLKNGIAYKKSGVVNWDPVDKTVLANEQVIDGKGWRSGAPVEKREIPMYYLAITKYTDELLDGLDKLEWPLQVLSMQKNWIGKSEGLRFSFRLNEKLASNAYGKNDRIYVFTTRPDTIMGATFIALSADHVISKNIIKNNEKIRLFIDKHWGEPTSSEVEQSRQEKVGIDTGEFGIHPISGERIRIWIANYVLSGYGDGAVMGVPAHDERDFLFAKKYDIKIVQVLKKSDENSTKTFDPLLWKEWYASKENCICINSGPYEGMEAHKASKQIIEDLSKQGVGEKKTQIRLRDWGISRQRYWGTPIPVVKCPSCGDVPVNEDQLPVILPKHLKPKGVGNPLTDCVEFLKTCCPVCGEEARRETDTMDTFVDSSWYFMRYCCPQEKKQIFNEEIDYWMPIDQYIGGIEHAILHLLYARFWTKVTRDLNLIKIDEPFTKLLTQGMVLNQTFFRESKNGSAKIYFNPSKIILDKDNKGRVVSATNADDGLSVQLGKIEKMSKSKNNGVDPTVLIEKYGADTCRVFTMFAAPPENTLEWSEDGVEGSFRFVKRLWAFHVKNYDFLKATHYPSGEQPETTENGHKLKKACHEILSQASYDMERFQFNTVVSATMKLLNTIDLFLQQSNCNKEPFTKKDSLILVESFSILLRVLYPIAPHICCYIWNNVGYENAFGALVDSEWPIVDKKALQQDFVDITIQINGKSRGRIKIPSSASDEQVLKIAQESKEYQKYCQTKDIRRTIIVPNRLINIVLKK